MILNHKQTIALDYLEDGYNTEVLFGGGAGGGKSILGTYWLAKCALRYPGTRWLMGRAEMKTLKETTLVSFFKVAAIQGLIAGRDFVYRDNPKNDITFRNGSVILLKDLKASPSDPNFDDLGSLEITGAFIDEANQISEKARNIVMSRIRHMLSEYGLKPKLLMSCNPAKNWVYRDFYKPHKEKELLEYRKFVQALATDNPDIDPAYIDNLMKLDYASQQRLRFGNWEYDDDPATMIEFDRILDCFKNRHLATSKTRLHKLTCDVARFGADKTVIGHFYSPEHVELKPYKNLDTTQTAAKLVQAKTQGAIGTRQIVVDEDGVGGGVVDQVKCVGFVNNARPLPAPVNPLKDKNGLPIPENYKNLKSQCYAWLAKRINEGRLYIECSDPDMKQAIIEELEQVKRADVDKDGKFAVVPKDEVKEILGRSPDFADALMMGELLELKPQFKVRSLYDKAS